MAAAIERAGSFRSTWVGGVSDAAVALVAAAARHHTDGWEENRDVSVSGPPQSQDLAAGRPLSISHAGPLGRCATQDLPVRPVSRGGALMRGALEEQPPPIRTTPTRPSSSGAIRSNDRRDQITSPLLSASNQTSAAFTPFTTKESRVGWQKRNPSVDSLFGIVGNAKTVWERKTDGGEEGSSNAAGKMLELQSPDASASLMALAGVRSDSLAAAALGASRHHKKSSKHLPALGGKRLAMHEASKQFAELTGGVDPKLRRRRISRAEDRGIMVKQLELLVDFLRRRSHPATAVLRGWKDMVTGEPLCLRTIDMYQLHRYLIKPLAQHSQCSYVEAIAFSDTAQSPTWFTSHCWAAPIVDLIDNIKKHALVRQPQTCRVTTAYWVSAFAFSPSEPETATVMSEAADWPVVKALSKASGMLLVIDSSSTSPQIFHRVWCCFEVNLLVQGLPSSSAVSFDNVLLDVACKDSTGTSQVITDGLTEMEEKMEEKWHSDPQESSGWALKTQRESGFPIKVFAEGLDIKVLDAKASKEADRLQLLAVMADRDIDTALDPQLPIYDEINAALRAKFASIAVRQAVQHRLDSFDDSSALPLAKVLRENVAADSLNLNFACCWQMTNKDLEAIASCIPLSQNLRRITLNLRSCYHITCLDKILSRVLDVTNLKHLVLLCENCLGLRQSSKFQELGIAIAHHGQLEKVFLDFKGCSKLGPLDDLVKALAQVPSVASCMVVDPAGELMATRERPKPQKLMKSRRMRKAMFRSRSHMLAWASSLDLRIDEERSEDMRSMRSARSVAVETNYSEPNS